MMSGLEEKFTGFLQIRTQVHLDNGFGSVLSEVVNAYIVM